jgi:hypothetical protein
MDASSKERETGSIKVVIDYRSTGYWAAPSMMPQCCPAQLKTLKRFVCAQAFLVWLDNGLLEKIEHDPFRKCLSMTI